MSELTKVNILERLAKTEPTPDQLQAIQSILDGQTLTRAAVEAVLPKRLLDLETKMALLVKLERRFYTNMKRHREAEWPNVQRSLKADPIKLWSLQQMENAGHAPDVYLEDYGAYTFGTCSEEAPVVHSNIVFDAEAEAHLRERYPEALCNGNAVVIAETMGINVMDEPHYRYLQTLGRFDIDTWNWLKPLYAVRRRGRALAGTRTGENKREVVVVSEANVDDHERDGAFRGSLKVAKVKAS